MKSIFRFTLCLFLFNLIQPTLTAAPTELREWHAKAGTTVEAKALQVARGKVQLERADGVKLAVALDLFTVEDQATLREHFEIEEAGPAGLEAPPEGEPAEDLPHPLGTTTEELSCGEFHYYLYLPKSLRNDAKHPVVFVMDPGGGKPGTNQRYKLGAERNRWIIAVSKESKNNFNSSQQAVDSMIKEVTSSLPIDEDRMYTSGFSGGSRMAFATATQHKDIAGVIACGAGGNLGSSKQIAYGLCGSNCFNRTDMANSFKRFRSKDGVLRYFPGMHVWAGDELIDDATTHLNGLFLIDEQKNYRGEFAHYLHQVSLLITEAEEKAPLRAYMWTSFLDDHKILPAALASIHHSLGADASNKLYAKGLGDIQKFAIGELGDNSASEWRIDPKTSAAFTREAAKYTGTPWQDVLERMSKDAQKF